MRTRRLLLVFVLPLGLFLALLWILGGQALSVSAAPASAPNPSSSAGYVQTRPDKEIPDALSAPGDVITVCLPPGVCDHDTIQAAVDSAGDGDLIKVATGSYTDIHERAGLVQVVYISRTVTIRGGYTTTNWTTPDPDANPTILDAQGDGRVLVIAGSEEPPQLPEGPVFSSGSPSGMTDSGDRRTRAVAGSLHPVIEGLRITGGDANLLGGGGEYWEIDAGGGIYVYSATATLTNNWVYQNTVPEGVGGGLHLYGGDSVLISNAIYSNTAIDGGGVYLDGSPYTPGGDAPTLNDNAIYSNTAFSSGGGLYLRSNDALLTQNDIHHNYAMYGGGGVYLGSWWFLGKGSDAQLRGNLVHHNSGDYEGGGLSMTFSDPLLSNNVIAKNQSPLGSGSGIFADTSNPRLIHNTIVQNTGGDGSGLFFSSFQELATSQAALTNTILVSHTCAVRVTWGSAATLNGVLWYLNGVNTDTIEGGTIAVTNDYTGTPAFAADDYHLTGSSQAIDRGIATSLSQDIDGQTRPQGLAADLGADEYPVGTIVILKQTDPAGGTGFGFTNDIMAPYSFDLDHAQQQTFSDVLSGTYTVTEDDPTPAFDLTGLACVEDVTGNSTVALASRRATISLDPDETVTCTFTNTKRGSIVIAKGTDPPGGTGFGFSGDLGPFTLDHAHQETFSDVAPGTYTVTEDDPTPAFDLTGLACIEDVNSNSSVSLGSGQATIDLDPDETVTCTFTNTKRGSITIAKQTDPPGGTGFSFTFGADVGPPQPLTLDDGDQQAFSNISAGTYYVTENLTTTFDLTALVCVEDVTLNSATDLGSRQATISLDPDETVTCIFTNTVSTAPTGGATDSGGLGKDTYNPDEIVYVTGTGFLPNTTVHLYIVPDHTWTDGLTIPADVSHDGMNPLLVDGSGDLGPSPVWPPQLTPGEYDLVFDANQNGRYDTATDVVDDPNHPGFVVDDISAVIDPDVGGTIVYTDPQGLITAITVPPGAVDEPVILCFHPLLEPSYALPTQMEYANHAFLLGECQFPGPPIPVGGVTFPFALPGLGPRGNAPGLYPYLPLIMRDDSGGCRILGNTAIGRPSPSRKALAAPYLRTVAYVSRAGALSAFTFDVPIVISVGYSDSDLPFGMDENDLLLLYWTGTEWADAATTCWPLSNYVRDTVNNILQVEVCHLTEFAFGG